MGDLASGERTKAELRALRSAVGMTQARLAESLGVTIRTVTRWETPGIAQRPPEGAWDLLGRLLAAQDRVVEETLAAARRGVAVRLVNWASPEDFEEHPPEASSPLGAAGPVPGAEPDWRMANATQVACALALRLEGLPFEWADAGAPDAAGGPRDERPRESRVTGGET